MKYEELPQVNGPGYWPAKIATDVDGRFLVSFPDFPEALTDGESLKDALTEAVDCLEEALAGRINRGEDIPAPARKKPGQYQIFPTPQFMLKVLLFSKWKAAGITKTELAARMSIREGEVRRLLDPRYGSKLPQMEKAFGALGCRIRIELEEVA
jgi:antitoxin HicB